MGETKAGKTLDLTTGGGLSIRLDDATQSIRLSDPHGNAIVMGPDGITIESAGAIRVKGLTVEAEAKASAKVDGGGMLQLKGGMVKLN